MYNCPYCNKELNSWKQIHNHIYGCSKANGEYYISLDHGPLHYSIFNKYSAKELKEKYPNLTKLSNIKNSFKRRGINIDIILRQIWTKDKVLTSVKEYIDIHGKVPSIRTFLNDYKYPCHETIRKYFSSYDELLSNLGYNISHSFGIPTFAKDNIRYRSKAEAYFVDTYLYNKYKYEYEPKYDNHNKYYDFYLPELNLYIEIDGGLRPQVIEEKIAINKQENKNLIVIPIFNLYNTNIPL